MSRYVVLFTLLALSVAVPTFGKEDPFSYFDAALINAYSASSYDVVYEIEYSATPIPRKQPSQNQPNVSIKTKLKGRHVYDRDHLRLLAAEQTIDLNKSIVDKIRNPSSKEIVKGFQINEVRDGKWSLYREFSPKPTIGMPGEFPELQEKCGFRALPLVGLHGWTARFYAAGMNFDRSRFIEIGEPLLKHQADDSIRIDLSRKQRGGAADSLMFGVIYDFDPKSFMVTHMSNYYDLPNESVRQSSHRQSTKYAEFNGIYLPVEVQLTTRVIVEPLGEVQAYNEDQKVTLKWKSVNEPDRLPLMSSAEIDSEKSLESFLGDE